MPTLQIVNEKQIDQLAWDFIDTISNRLQAAKACVVFLKGDLGAGKTTFIKAVAGALGIEEEVTSPTFVILKRYPINNMGDVFPFTDLIHIDAYRLKSYDELAALKFDTYLFNPKFLIMIEWPEMIHNPEMKPDIFMKFSHTDEVGKRMVETS
ncbi:MAG: tRNA threonylcarbamoyladenosine biosynthesis protein TsaE [Candidatus Parcubacteria bacterium]|jgi:tRNA threonylcarbamoyladenosine biosynthesis protein TsaE